MRFDGAALHRLHVDDGLKAYIPAPQPDELAALAASLQAEGCRDALIAWDDVLLDGHNRYALCHRLGIPFRVESRSFASVDDARLWMIDNQLGRRNLTDYQRGALALQKKGIIADRAKRNQAAGRNQHSSLLENSPTPSINTREEIAAIAGVSSNTIAKIEKIEANGVPAIVAAARTKLISIHAAAGLAALPADAQRAIAAGGNDAIKAAARGAARKKPRAAPAPAPAVAPAPPPAADTAAPAAPSAPAPADAADDLAAQNAQLRAELAELADSFQETLDEHAALSKIVAADDRLAEAVAEIKKLQELNRVLNARVSGLTNEKNDYIRLAQKHKSIADRLEREMKRLRKDAA